MAEDEGKSEKEAKTKMIGNVVVVEEEESTLDEGIGTKDKSDSEPEVVDLTDDVEVSFRSFEIRLKTQRKSLSVSLKPEVVEIKPSDD